MHLDKKFWGTKIIIKFELKKNQEKSLISIITPVYNSSKYLEQTLKSVLIQSYSNFEYIIIDDGSTDKSIDIIKSYEDPRIKLFSQRNCGVSNARNFALTKVTGEYIIYLDSDDTLIPNALEILISNINDNDIIFGGWEDFDNTGRILKSKRTELIDNDPIATYFNFLPTISTALIKKNDILWNTELKIWEVTQYFLENNYKIVKKLEDEHGVNFIAKHH